MLTGASYSDFVTHFLEGLTRKTRISGWVVLG